MTSSAAVSVLATLLVSTLADTARLLFVFLHRGEVVVDLHERLAEDVDLALGEQCTQLDIELRRDLVQRVQTRAAPWR